MGRQRKVKIEDLVKDADEYIRTASPPILAEYAHMHGITREHLYHLADIAKRDGDESLYHTIKRISEAKEINLEKGALSGEYPPTMAIFSLKQLGWKDRLDVDANAEAIERIDELIAKIGGAE